MTLASRRVAASPVSADTFVLARRPLQPGTVLTATSRFADDVWQLSPALLQMQQQSSIMNFGDVSTELRYVAKELFLALLRFDLPPGERNLSIESVRKYFSDVKAFLNWADQRGATTLRSVTLEDLAAYQQQLENSRLSQDTRGGKRRAVRLFWLFRAKLSDPIVLDPATVPGWDEQTINPGRGENATPRIPEEVLAPLLTWAFRWIDDFADDVLAAHTEWAALYAQTLNNRQRRGEKGIGDVRSRLRVVLDRYRTEQRRLPLGAKGVNHAQLGREIGCDPGPLYGVACQRIIDEAAAELGIDDGTYLRAPVTGQLDGRPWRGRIAYTDVELLGRMLQAAGYIVIAYLSGMRDSEVKHLRRGCLSRRKDEAGRTYRRTVTSRAFKGEGTPAGVTATWIVTEPVERAITVLEKLQPATEPFLFAVLHSSRSFLQARETGVKSTEASNLDIAAFVDWINAYSTGQDRPDQVPFVNGRRLRLTTRQFRRTLAWFIARRPGGVIAGAIQYRHHSVQMFEGYAGTSDSGFRAEVQAEQAITRSEKLVDIVVDHSHNKLTGPAADEAETRLTEYVRHAQFHGKVITDRQRMQRLLARHDPHVFPGEFVTCVHNPDRALCHSPEAADQPNLPQCQPFRCRNVALTPENRAALGDHRKRLHAAVQNGTYLAPYLRHRLQTEHDEIDAFLNTHAHPEDCIR